MGPSKWKLLFFLSIMGCQTLTPIKKNEISKEIKSGFGNCWEPEGSRHFSFSKRGEPLLSAVFDFVRKDTGMTWEIYDPLGRVLSTASVRGGRLAARGAFADHLRKVKISENGRMIYDGHDLYFHWNELNCFLNFRLPEDWLDFRLSLSKDSTSQHSVVNFEDTDRSIQVTFQETKACGFMETAFLGLFKHKHATWCISRNPEHAFLDLQGEFRIEWFRQEEEDAQ